MHRRRYLAAVAGAGTGALAGCLGSTDGNSPGNGNDSIDGNGSTDAGEPTDDAGNGSAERDPEELHDCADTVEACWPYVTVHDHSGSVGDLAFAADGGGWDGVEPYEATLALVNDGDASVTVEFEGFVPFPETRARVDDPESSDELLVVPDEQVVPEAPDPRAHVPEFEFVGEFYQLSAPLEAPDGTTTVTIEPDSELRAPHVVASPVGSLDPAGPAGDRPQHGIYEFESTLRLVEGPAAPTEFDVGFSVIVDSWS